MIINIVYFPIRAIHVVVLSLMAIIHFGFAKAFNGKNFDLGKFYQKNFENLGGTFIKIGQVLSVRYDILPRSQCEALAKLQDNVKPFNEAKGIKIIHAELNEKATGFTINPKPFAAGSLCQVYLAENKDGDKLAIKVKRPLIGAKLFADTLVLNTVKYFLITTGIGRKVGAPRLIDEVVEVLKNELDYAKESRQIELFSPIAKKYPTLVVPEFYPRLSTNKVLTMDYLDGMPLSKFIAQEKEERSFDENELCKTIYEIYINCMFDGGTFHADAHPGNIFIMPDGKIGLVDFGVVGVLNRNMRKKNFNYLLALSNAQTEKAAEIYASILDANNDSDREGLMRDTKLELDIYLKRVQDPSSGLAEKSSANLYINSIAFARKYNFTFPKNVFLFYKTLFTLDNVLLKLNPNFDAKQQTSRVLEEITKNKILEELRFDNIMEKLSILPEIISSLPDIVKLSKTALEKENSNNNSNWNQNKHMWGVICLLVALALPILFYARTNFLEQMNVWIMSSLALLLLIVSIRLKQ